MIIAHLHFIVILSKLFASRANLCGFVNLQIELTDDN